MLTGSRRGRSRWGEERRGVVLADVRMCPLQETGAGAGSDRKALLKVSVDAGVEYQSAGKMTLRELQSTGDAGHRSRLSSQAASEAPGIDSRTCDARAMTLRGCAGNCIDRIYGLGVTLVVVTTPPEMESVFAGKRIVAPPGEVTSIRRIDPSDPVITRLIVPKVVPELDFTVRPVFSPGNEAPATEPLARTLFSFA